jgi:hypothetical protein
MYERFGVIEYRVVDPELEVVKIYSRDGDSFSRAAELTAEHGHALTTPLLPQSAVPLAKIFAPPL